MLRINYEDANKSALQKSVVQQKRVKPHMWQLDCSAGAMQAAVQLVGAYSSDTDDVARCWHHAGVPGACLLRTAGYRPVRCPMPVLSAECLARGIEARVELLPPRSCLSMTLLADLAIALSV